MTHIPQALCLLLLPEIQLLSKLCTLFVKNMKASVWPNKSNYIGGVRYMESIHVVSLVPTKNIYITQK